MYDKLINALETAKEMNIGVTVIEHTTPYVGRIEHLVSDRWGHRISLDGSTSPGSVVPCRICPCLISSASI